MKSLTGIFGLLLLGSVLSPAVVSAEASRPQNGSAEPLAPAVRAAFHTGSASYLHNEMASALGMNPGVGDGISVYQRETNADKDSGRLMAVTLLEKDGRHQIIFAWWNTTEIRAYLTSETGVLKKAVRGTQERGWEPVPAGAAQTGFATEKNYWVNAAAAPRPGSPMAPAQ